MTEADRVDFGVTMTALCRARGRKLDTEQITGLFSLLDDVPFDRLRPALEHSAKNDRYFPDVPSIRKALTDLQARRPSPPWPTASAIREGDRYCDVCDDTGWEPYTMGSIYGEGATVPAVRRCGCRERNPIYRAKRASERPLAVGRREE